MKDDDGFACPYVDFLSDLCGREEKFKSNVSKSDFLSDLCGREEATNAKLADGVNFLSDLCGREGLKGNADSLPIFLSDLCGREVNADDLTDAQFF